MGVFYKTMWYYATMVAIITIHMDLYQWAVVPSMTEELMNTILIHIGCQGPYISSPEPPAHLYDCIRQYRLFNTGDLYVMTDRAYLGLIPQLPGVFPVAAEDYYSDKVDEFHARYKYGRHEFWGVSTTRFFYLEEFMRKHGPGPACHFENDVLVYFDLARLAPVFKRLYGPRLAYPPCDADQCTSGFMYVGGVDALAHFNAYVVDMLTEHGMYGFEQKFKVHMMNDMTLLRRYADTRGAGGVHFLPVLPFGEYSQGIEALGGLFDPGDFGQYIGGTRDGSGAGTTYEGHVVGGVLRANPEYAVTFQDEAGLRVPYFKHGDKSTRMNSLHIHSKNMPPFMSRHDG